MITSKRGKLMSEINVTPFVDVTLVLLIIFMVTVPMMTHGVKVSVPQTTHAKMPVTEEAVIISVDAAGTISIDSHTIAFREIHTLLPTLFDVAATRDVYLKADRNLSYGYVMNIMAEIKDAGIQKIGMVTEPLSGEAENRR